MVIDGIRYGAGLGLAAVLVTWLLTPWAAIPFILAALFCLYFFRDPERKIPEEAVPLAVSPADGKVVDIRNIEHEGCPFQRISIFLNVFDVHVNRSPVGGQIRQVEYHPGKFMVASRLQASIENERNTVTVESPGGIVVFKQIAGLIARRIVFTKKAGDTVACGERIGLMKFGSRMDVLLGPEWQLAVKAGDRVRGGSSVLARRA